MSLTTAQLTDQYTKIHVGLAPDASTIAALTLLASQTFTGSLTDAQALLAIADGADADTAVAISSYELFTGKSPTAAGLSFLVNSGVNTTDLNDPYYAQFNATNRYINFAQNLGLLGDGAVQFKATYGTLTFAQTVAALYETIIGVAQATAAGLDPSAAIADIATRLPYFTQVAAERFVGLDQDLAVKAALAGYILSEAMKADVGKYAVATENMLLSVGADTAIYNTDILATYGTTSPPPPPPPPPVSPPPPPSGFGASAPTPSSNPQVDLSAASVPLTGLAPSPGATVVVGHASNVLTLTLTDASGLTDTVGVTLATSAAAVAGVLGGVIVKLAAPNVEGLYVTSSGALSGGAATNVLNLDPAIDHFSRIDVYGSAPIAINLGAYTTSAILSGGGATGELRLNAASVTDPTVGVNMNGGSANDTLSPVALGVASGVNVLLYGGGGGDLFNLGGHSEHDTLVYKLASDSVFDATGVSGASGTSTANAGKMDLVNGYVTGQDKLDFTLFGFNTAQTQIVDKGTVADAAALSTLAGTGTFFQDAGAVTRSFVEVHIGADTYLFVDTDKNGVYAAGDLVVKFVGVAAIGHADLQF